jgi:hypothetical protein
LSNATAVRVAGEPRSAASRLAGTLRRAALAAGEDLLRPAPSSALNARIGPRRRLVPIAEGHALSIGIFSYRDTLGRRPPALASRALSH